MLNIIIFLCYILVSLFTMINIKEFTERLQKVLTYYSLSASAFADKIGVQRSSISHILSGRNKPSLEFVTKILSAFPEVDLYWLLNGSGSFPKKESEQTTLTEKATPSLFNKQNASQHSKEIDKIIIFYKDGSF